MWCKLHDIVEFIGGYAYKSNTYVSKSDYQVVRIGNVKNDFLNLENQPVFVPETIGNQTDKYRIYENDILFTMTGTKGKRDYFFTTVVRKQERILLLNQRVGCLRPFTKELDINYLSMVLKGKYILDSIFSTETGNVSQGNIGSENTLNLLVALPPYVEQQRIVKKANSFFDMLNVMDERKINLQDCVHDTRVKILDLAIHGKLVPQDPNDEAACELLKRINPKAEITCDNPQYGKLPSNWCETTLGELFNHNTGKALNSSNTEGTMMDYLTTSNVYWNTFDFSIVKKMLFKEYELDKCRITKGDLLVCEGGDIGRAAIWNQDYDICIQNHIHRLRPKVKLSVPFYYYTLLYLKANNMIGGKGIGLLGLSSNALHKIHFPLPPLSEQHRIVAKVEELFAQLDKIEASL